MTQKRKFRSVRRRKRKSCNPKAGSGGKRLKQELEDADRPVPTTSHRANEEETPQEEARPSTSSDQKDGINKSQVKLLNSSFSSFEGQSVSTRTRSKKEDVGDTVVPSCEQAHGFKLQDYNLLQETLDVSAICSNCRRKSSKLTVLQKNSERDGLAEKLVLKCNSCSNETELNTSRRLGGRGGGPYEVNRRSVIAALSTGGGRASLENFCTQMNLPPPVTSNAFQDHLEQIERASTENAEELMVQAAERLRDIILKDNPDVVNEDPDGAIPCRVTIDGTWQKRGHSSKMGVIFVISVLTGEILDYEVKSLFCHECKYHEELDRDSKEYKDWHDRHRENCSINHEGSAGAMEASAAIDIFKRSLETRKLKYTVYVGDGDTDSYGKVKEAMEQEYGERYVIEKEDCVGHIQKRMGTALRTYKKNMKGKKLGDGKSVGGQRRLTDGVIDDMQSYYGKAIRGHKGDLKGMRTAVWAIYNHMICSSTIPLKEQHQYCPKGTGSWCKYNKDPKTYSDQRRLPEVFRAELKPIFERLSSDALLKRCLQGLTQNQNESVNGQLWSRCPKTRFCGKRRLLIAVCETVGVFNTGAASKALTMSKCGIRKIGKNTFRGLRKQDKSRVSAAAQKIKAKYRNRRRQLRRATKTKNEKASRKSKSYISGAFGLEKEPEISDGKKKRGKRKQGKQSNDGEDAVESTEEQEEFPVLFVEEAIQLIERKARN